MHEEDVIKISTDKELVKEMEAPYGYEDLDEEMKTPYGCENSDQLSSEVEMWRSTATRPFTEDESTASHWGNKRITSHVSHLGWYKIANQINSYCASKIAVLCS